MMYLDEDGLVSEQSGLAAGRGRQVLRPQSAGGAAGCSKR